MTSEPLHLGKQIDKCDVCSAPIQDLGTAETAQYGHTLLSFCSTQCHGRYIEDPALYAEFEDDQVTK